MLPENIKNLLKELFSVAGFSGEEINKKIETIDTSFANLVTAKLLQQIPQEKQDEVGGELKKAKTPGEAIKTIGELFAGNLKEEDFKKVYQDELVAILEEIFKPLRELATKEQLEQIRRLIETKYLH